MRGFLRVVLATSILQLANSVIYDSGWVDYDELVHGHDGSGYNNLDYGDYKDTHGYTSNSYGGFEDYSKGKEDHVGRSLSDYDSTKWEDYWKLDTHGHSGDRGYGYDDYNYKASGGGAYGEYVNYGSDLGHGKYGGDIHFGGVWGKHKDGQSEGYPRRKTVHKRTYASKAGKSVDDDSDYADSVVNYVPNVQREDSPYAADDGAYGDYATYGSDPGYGGYGGDIHLGGVWGKHKDGQFEGYPRRKTVHKPTYASKAGKSVDDYSDYADGVVNYVPNVQREDLPYADDGGAYGDYATYGSNPGYGGYGGDIHLGGVWGKHKDGQSEVYPRRKAVPVRAYGSKARKFVDDDSDYADNVVNYGPNMQKGNRPHVDFHGKLKTHGESGLYGHFHGISKQTAIGVEHQNEQYEFVTDIHSGGTLDDYGKQQKYGGYKTYGRLKKSGQSKQTKKSHALGKLHQHGNNLAHGDMRGNGVLTGNFWGDSLGNGNTHSRKHDQY